MGQQSGLWSSEMDTAVKKAVTAAAADFDRQLAATASLEKADEKDTDADNWFHSSLDAKIDEVFVDIGAHGVNVGFQASVKWEGGVLSADYEEEENEDAYQEGSDSEDDSADYVIPTCDTTTAPNDKGYGALITDQDLIPAPLFDINGHPPNFKRVAGNWSIDGSNKWQDSGL